MCVYVLLIVLTIIVDPVIISLNCNIVIFKMIILSLSLIMMCACTLPERQENDWFDSEELPDRIIWTQQFPGGKIKQEQSVEGQTDGHIVDQGDVQESWGRPTNSQSGQAEKIQTLLLYSFTVLYIAQYYKYNTGYKAK